jgi:hypothetical protein
MTETNLHDTMDAKVWAAEFVKTFLNNPCIAADEGTMIGWFANAIMAGFDEANRRTETRLRAAERDAARLRELEQANTDLADESERLRDGLRFYAHGMHYEGFGTWEGPSGDDNWLCPPSPEFSDYQEFINDLDQHMLEDGAVARCYLSGKRADWEGEEPPEHPCEPVMKAIAEAEKDAALAGSAQEEGR